MKGYLSRYVAQNLREDLSIFRVLVLTGARQVGKTTLALNEEPFRHWTYLSLDDWETLELAEKAPSEIFALGKDLIIDEVQKAPKLVSYVKLFSDQDPERRFLLTGSSHLLLMKEVAESLAGRAAYRELLPLTLSEVYQQPLPSWLLMPERLENLPKSPLEEDILWLLFRGFLPPLLRLTKPRQVFSWWQSYVRTYLERDLRDLAHITHLPDYRRLMRLLVLRTGGILKISDLARDLGLPQTTVSRYIHLLETSCLLIRLPAFTNNMAKRVIKSPKVYFLDPGLASHLMDKRNLKDLSREEQAKLFENLVFLNLYVFSEIEGGRLYYFRTYGGREKEVDFVLEVAGSVVGVEVKFEKEVGFKDVENLRFFREITPSFQTGFVIYLGERLQKLGKDLYAVPWRWL